jgi:hypothetical protein
MEATMLIDIAINILWLVIGIIALLGVIWLGFRALRLFMEVDAQVEKAVYLIALILIIIAALTLLAGRGSFAPSFFRRGAAIDSGPVATISRAAARYHAAGMIRAPTIRA